MLTSGGRVLAVVALENSLKAAIYHSYNGLLGIDFDDMFYRNDIAGNM